MATPRPVEIAVQDPAGARVAIGAGAARLELCQALEVGGLTPSLGILEAVLGAVDPAAVNVLVRPRGGGFVYDADEIAIVSADIRACVGRGAGGVVIGCLDAAGGLDVDTLRRWRDAADPATLVFHRAVDAAADPAAVFDALVAEGVDRVLTSGGAARSIDGLDALAAFAARSGDVEVMAGGGVQPADVPALFAAGVDAVHLSARGRAGLASPSGPGGGADGHDVTDPQIVGAAVRAATV
ncbi:copper homeostasis protein CutC [Microbacterium sp. M3]|uniref:PF03932 family protein CutC n=1 Tax=Microbacterium arthrosphaerae TaxID=792652 RepID=A0ABU4H0R8_9MICO|nr:MULTISPECIES: copper homeostasis protein CutC [Microbacterium]MDW4572926.1 copper homeostasis protein CutC [Microbacterium arthrosphaerae]MDW7606781.1 copper homeostasis protein CutC [Microbacterium sp. M3]